MTRIKQLRKILDFTQAKMANQLGVARSTVSMWEVSNQEPDYDTLKKITLLYHVPADYVMGRGVFSQWDDIIKYYDEVSFTLVNMIPAGFELPVFSDEKSLIAWLDTRLYFERDELALIRFFAFAVGEISLIPVEDPVESEARINVDISFTRDFAALIKAYEPEAKPKVVSIADAFLRECYDLLQKRDQEIIKSLIMKLLRPNQDDMSSSSTRTLLDCYSQLNEEGQEKIAGYADDLVKSGKYIKSGPNSVGKTT